ncbi:DUF262 domain-containing protein [bacterium]|nr:DUF262 domain-containing protein [bacterium]
MANIYESRDEEIHALLNRASAGTGATVVIPDLQRPYVWEPNQVILLVDSLIRGWPFGTLLMWKVDHKELQGIPHREFWQVVDKRTEGKGSTMIRKDPPAQYHMVLDGQQRLQSLLLALGGDGWGFKLEDRDWLEQLEGIRPRGRKPKYPHWTKGTLCFDVEAFHKAYLVAKDVIGIDYRNVLRWAVTDSANGQSTWAKPDNYRQPLEKAFMAANKGRFIRLSRLWSEVPPNANIKEKQFREIAEDLLKEHEVAAEVGAKVLEPMGELMSTLRDVKLSKITFLELRPYDKNLWSEDEYNDAIVNIFTRLNTAGRTLTREEITFAWLKVGWDDTATSGNTAGKCFESLLEAIRGKGLPIEMDDLVRAVSFIWAVAHHNGVLLSDKDLLKGDTVKPMAHDLAAGWTDIVRTIEALLDTAKDRGLKYGQAGQYDSLNAVNVLWCWAYQARRWLTKNPQKVKGDDAYEKRVAELLEERMDRWLICSQWAGKWGSSSGAALVGYAKDLHSDGQKLAATTDAAAALTIIADRITALTDGVIKDAVQYVQAHIVSLREQVSRYNRLLWVWHRLDAARWKMSSVPLRSGRRQDIELEVDHNVAHALWEGKVKATAPKDDEEAQELIQEINRLGNCSLLEKNFNLSKSDKTLRAFLADVYEFKSAKLKLDDWAKALVLGPEFLDPDKFTLKEIEEAIKNREETMRKEIVEFAQGARQRQDLQPAAPAADGKK